MYTDTDTDDDVFDEETRKVIPSETFNSFPNQTQYDDLKATWDLEARIDYISNMICISKNNPSKQKETRSRSYKPKIGSVHKNSRKTQRTYSLPFVCEV